MAAPGAMLASLAPSTRGAPRKPPVAIRNTFSALAVDEDQVLETNDQDQVRAAADRALAIVPERPAEPRKRSHRGGAKALVDAYADRACACRSHMCLDGATAECAAPQTVPTERVEHHDGAQASEPRNAWIATKWECAPTSWNPSKSR